MMTNQSFRATRLVALAVLLTVTGAMSVFAQQPPPAPLATGKLKGVVVDWQYARILRSCLTVRNKTFQSKVMVDEEGAFEAELPAGVYEVVALSPGFSRLRRKDVRIEPGASTTLNFLLEVAPEISGRCPANTIRRGDLCDSLCDTHPASNNGMHPTAGTTPLINRNLAGRRVMPLWEMYSSTAFYVVEPWPGGLSAESREGARVWAARPSHHAPPNKGMHPRADTNTVIGGSAA